MSLFLRFIEPTILLDPPTDASVMNEEIFGPILPIITVIFVISTPFHFISFQTYHELCMSCRWRYNIIMWPTYYEAVIIPFIRICYCFQLTLRLWQFIEPSVASVPWSRTKSMPLVLWLCFHLLLSEKYVIAGKNKLVVSKMLICVGNIYKFSILLINHLELFLYFSCASNFCAVFEYRFIRWAMQLILSTLGTNR